MPDDLSLAALIDPVATTAVYMPLRTWSELADKLIHAGLSPETPAIAVIDATCETQNSIIATVATLGERLRIALGETLESRASSRALLVMFGAACHYAPTETFRAKNLMAAE